MIELIEEYNMEKYIVKNKLIDYEKKWKPVIENVLKDFKIKIKSVKFFTEVSLFLEAYSIIESKMPKYERFDVMSVPGTRVKSYPDGYIQLVDSLSLIIEDIENFIINDTTTKLNIINEYYNAVTGKRGFLLEEGIRVEDDEFINPKNQEKIDNEIMRIVNRRIEYILSVSKRKFYDRVSKIKRILK